MSLELATLIAQSAAKAVGGMAVRASAPAWRAAAHKLRPAPSEVRKSPYWSEVKLAKAQEEKVSAYLSGRLCAGLLEIWAYLEITEETGEAVQERERLGQAFAAELAEKLDLAEEQSRRIAAVLWADLCDCVRLYVRQLREENVFSADDLVYATSLRQGAPERSALSSAISERWTLSPHRQRVTAAQSAIRVVRQAMRARYAKLVMPHSRDDYQVPIEQIYVSRFLTPRPGFRAADDRTASSEPIPEEELNDRRFVVVGHPGAGKSTFIRNLLYRVADKGGKDGESAMAPMVVELKDHPSPTDSYLRILAETLRVVAQAEFDVEVIRDILRLGLAVVVFDGLDEIADIDLRRATVTAIEMFSRRYPLVTVVVTSREEGYLRARLDAASFPVYYLPDFTDGQLRHYVKQWFRIIADSRDFPAGERARNFLDDSVHVGDLRTNPLMLSLLCMIYEYEGYIPENRPQVYEECAELLFERWDRVRRVPVSFKSNTQTRYLIQELAYNFFNNDGGVLGGLPEGRLKQNIKDYFQRNVVDDVKSASSQAQDFLDFCAGRAWLLAQTGTSERGDRLFGFTHRTFLEYFAACFIVRHCESARGLIEMIRPMIQHNTSEVVPQIAIQQFDARRADGIDDCLELLALDSSRRIHLDFALRCLRFMRPSPRMLERLCAAAIAAYSRSLDTQLLVLLMSAPREVAPIARRTCARILADNPAAEIAAGAAIVDELFARVEDGTAPRDLDEGVDGGPKAVRELVVGVADRLGSAYPEVLAELCRRGLLAASHYVAALGPRALVSVPVSAREEGPGPLAERLRMFFAAGELHPELHEMLACLADKPEAVVPMSWPVVAGLAEISTPGEAIGFSGKADPGPAPELATREMFDDEIVLADLLASDELQDGRADDLVSELRPPFETAVVRDHFPPPPGGPASSTGFYLLFVAILLAAFEHETWRPVELSGVWRLIGTRLPGFATIFQRYTRADKETGQLVISREDLAACVLEYTDVADVAPAWNTWCREWANGTVTALSR